jgi:hypothetical protein
VIEDTAFCSLDAYGVAQVLPVEYSGVVCRCRARGVILIVRVFVKGITPSRRLQLQITCNGLCTMWELVRRKNEDFSHAPWWLRILGSDDVYAKEKDQESDQDPDVSVELLAANMVRKQLESGNTDLHLFSL